MEWMNPWIASKIWPDFISMRSGNVQAHGPYALIGYSLGGLVALEMAQQLSAPGRESRAAGHAGRISAHAFLVVGAAFTPRRASGETGIACLPKSQRQRALSAASGRIVDCRRCSGCGPADKCSAYPLPSPLLSRGNQVCARGGQPAFPADAAAVWRTARREELEVATVPGDHLGIIATHYGEPRGSSVPLSERSLRLRDSAPG